MSYEWQKIGGKNSAKLLNSGQKWDNANKG